MKTALSLVLVAITLFGCRDTVTDNYATLAAARADRLFERGWLPDVLPPSAHSIITSNDVDLNISTGRFSLAPAESPELYKRLSAGAPQDTKFADWPDTVSAYAARGYTLWSYRNERGTWTFFCTADGDRCEYFMS